MKKDIWIRPFYDFENTISNKTNAIETSATLRESFYFIFKTNQ
jgi:hypothetical protein